MQILQEASLTKCNMAKRWKKDDLSDVFCSRNYKKYGCNISLINVKGRLKGVIIIHKIKFQLKAVEHREKGRKFY